MLTPGGSLRYTEGGPCRVPGTVDLQIGAHELYDGGSSSGNSRSTAGGPGRGSGASRGPDTMTRAPRTGGA